MSRWSSRLTLWGVAARASVVTRSTSSSRALGRVRMSFLLFRRVRRLARLDRRAREKFPAFPEPELRGDRLVGDPERDADLGGGLRRAPGGRPPSPRPPPPGGGGPGPPGGPRRVSH